MTLADQARVKDHSDQRLGSDTYCHGRISKGSRAVAEADLGSIQALYNLGVGMNLGREFNRTRQRLPNSSHRRPCRDIPRVGTILAVMRKRRGITTVQ